MSCAAASGSVPSTSRSADTDKLARYRLDGDVVDGEAAVARDHHHAIAHGFVIERAWLGRDRDFGVRQFGADGARQPLRDGRDTVERQRAAHADAKIDEQHRAGRPRPHPLDGDDARLEPRDCRDPLADACRRRVGQCIDGAPPEPPAGDADEHRNDERRSRIGPRIAERHAAQARSAPRPTTTCRSRNAARRLRAPRSMSPWRRA